MKNDRLLDREIELDGAESDASEAVRQIVYIRPVSKAELSNAKEIEADGPFYAIHDAEGRPLALFDDRAAAFVLARSQNMVPMSVH